MHRDIFCFLILMLCLLSKVQFVIVDATKDEQAQNVDSPENVGEQQEERVVAKIFRSGGVFVHVVPNFLPYDLAVKWRDTMSQEWNTCYKRYDATEATTCSATNNQNHGWQYATNNNGVFNGGFTNNAKVRTLANIVARNETAQKMKKANLFSYSKWELHHEHPLVKEMEQVFLSKEMIEKVQNILSETTKGDVELDSQELSDLFVTLYSTGDFLSMHNDGISGTFAFVISLMDAPKALITDHWKDHFGGGLRFQCQTQGWCEELKPSFNTAILFQTRDGHGGSGPMHEVLPVSYHADIEGFRRFGVTGWYMDRKDIMPDDVRAERDQMRAK